MKKWTWFGLTVLACVALAGNDPVAVHAEQVTKLPRVGLLANHDCDMSSVFAELGQLGWIDGKTMTVECRHVGGQAERLPEAAAQIVRLDPDVILAVTNSAAFAAKKATSRIPIVVFGAHAAVEVGLVASLARPGGNITGVESLAPQLDAKRLELLKEIVPRLSTIAVLYNALDQGSLAHLESVAEAGRKLGVVPSSLEVRKPADFEAVLQVASEHLPEGLLTFTSPLTFSQWNRVAAFALARRLPTICEFKEMVSAGCLVSYGPSFAEFGRINARQIDRILRGAKVAELPFEQPTRYELAINLAIARALGITIPKEVLVRADQVIE
jgi:putative ABC transport system substrate-binding protein